MEHLVFNRKRMEFRYGSGMTVYTELFRDGRLLASDIHGAGMPQNEDNRLWDCLTPAFRLEVDGQDATYDWTFANWQTGTDEKGRPYGEVFMTHANLGIGLAVRTLCGENGYFTREMRLTNHNETPISITRVSPFCGSLFEMTEDVAAQMEDGDAKAFCVGSMEGCYPGMEGQFAWKDVGTNSVLEVGSDSGRSGHTHPFAVAHSHLIGGYFVAQLEWSSNWCFRFKNEFRYYAGGAAQYLRLLFDLAPKAMSPMRVLEAGESVDMPPVHVGYTCGNFDDAIQALHAYQRKYILARPPKFDGKEYLSYDPWGYNGWDANEERYLKELDRAHALGAEMFVVDAGWYGAPGSDWYATVGDWDTPRLANDLFPVIQRTHEYGMAFGLWVEIESVGADSQLRQDHPEYLMRRYGEKMERCLDLADPEVEAYLEGQLRYIIKRYSLDMLRLDYNNIAVNEGGFSKNGAYSENSHWRHVEAIHRIFDHIRRDFPDLRLENCSSGGGRTDVGMMSRFSQTQVSDWYLFPRVCKTLNGMTMCLPPEHIMTIYGGAMGQERYGGSELQMQMMVQGNPRIDGLALSEEEINPALLSRLRDYIALYKDFIRPIMDRCKVYHHTPQVPGIAARGELTLEYMTEDGSKGYAWVVRMSRSQKEEYVFTSRGADEGKSYRITLMSGGRSFVIGGYVLVNTGVKLHLDGALQSQMILMEAVDRA